MLRPKPTVIETGGIEDMRQYEELVENKDVPITPHVKQHKIFTSPDVLVHQRQIITTPTGQPGTPRNG